MENKNYYDKIVLDMNGHNLNRKYKKNNIKTQINTNSFLNKKEEYINNDIKPRALNKQSIINENVRNNHNNKYSNILKIKEEDIIIDEEEVPIEEKNKNELIIQQKKHIKKTFFGKPIENNFILNKKHDKNEEKINNNNLSLNILKNYQNSTYINSVIRIILNIPEISNYYLGISDIIKKNKVEMPISFFYLKILYHLYKSNPPSVYSLEDFYKILREYNLIFKGNETKDAIDFLIYFINTLHEENKLILKNKKIYNEIDFHNYNNYMKYLKENENTKIFENFFLINTKLEKCLSCNNEKKSYQKFFTYDLDFKNSLNNKLFNSNKNNNNNISELIPLSVFDCLKYTFEKKKIYNIFCDKCNQNLNFLRLSSIAKSSKYIIFLIRGMDNELINRIKKDNIIIHIDKDLPKDNSNKSSYTLYGFILYNSEQKEYIAYCMSPYNKKWYQYIKDYPPSELTDFIYDYNYKLIPVILIYKSN